MVSFFLHLFSLSLSLIPPFCNKKKKERKREHNKKKTRDRSGGGGGGGGGGGSGRGRQGESKKKEKEIKTPKKLSKIKTFLFPSPSQPQSCIDRLSLRSPAIAAATADPGEGATDPQQGTVSCLW